MKKNLLLSIVLIPVFGFSQYEFYNKGADVYIQDRALVHVQGTVTNDNTSGLQTDGMINNGMLEIKGDIENKTGAKFGTTGGSQVAAVSFVGSGKQRIKGDFNSDTAHMYNMVIEQQSASDSVEMQASVLVEGSLVFGSQNSGTPPTYSPDFYIPGEYTDYSGTNGLLKTFDANGEYLLSVQYPHVNAVYGYTTPSMSFDPMASPTTAYILTKGNRGSANGGFQRKVNSQSDYTFPIGTIENGYNSAILHFTTVPSGGGKYVKAKFCDGTSNPRGYVGTINYSCTGCVGAGSQHADNNGYNRYFGAGSGCLANPQWVIFEEGGMLEHGYWSFDAENNNLTPAQWKYWIETFPNSFVAEGNTDDTWRALKYHSSNNDFGTDPSDLNVDWGSQLENVNNINDLLTYTRIKADNGTPGCYTGAGIPGGIYSNFSDFSDHKSNSGNALPVKLIYLKAEAINNEYIKTSWATALEINNDGFEVYRSTDAVNFTYQGWVDGHDNSTVTNLYAFDDHNVVPNVVYYYKLRQLDNDGHSEETYVVQAMITNGETFVISDFVPNPTHNASKIMITTSTEQSIGIKLYDVIGQQIVSDRTYNLSVGQNDIYFDAQNFADGTYTAVITAQNRVYSKKLVVTKY